MKNYASILKTERLRTTDVPGRNIVTESESDRGRIIFCAAFRRLQQKAQVFSMEPNAAVRSRLTHSLEVSQLGRYIADEISLRLKGKDLIEPQEQIALVNFVEAACLMHDIGNPPFGHFGETAIQKWFQENGKKCIEISVKLDSGTIGSGDPRLISALADFKEFDGNPQGLRIAARLQWNTDEFGLNLTKTTLASFLKYVRRAGESATGNFSKKAGYFSTEDELVKIVWDSFDYKKPQRFPLAYIMEAADDIAYCVSDLEDSFEKGLIHGPSAFKEIEEKFLAHSFSNNPYGNEEIRLALRSIQTGRREDGKEYTYTDFRTALNRTMVAYVADRYVHHHSEILDGTLDALLPTSSPCGAMLDALKTYCRTHVYDHESIQRTELAGYTAIRGLLDHCSPLLICTPQRFQAALKKEKKDPAGEPIIIESKLLKLFPEKYIKVYQKYIENIAKTEEGKFQEWNARAHLVTDFISGMTDDFAMTTYRTLAGMRL